MNEYIIINKTTLKKRIEDLRQVCNKELGYASDKIYFELDNLLSESTSLIPELENAYYTALRHRGEKVLPKKTIKDYISNLKLNI